MGVRMGRAVTKAHLLQCRVYLQRTRAHLLDQVVPYAVFRLGQGRR